MGVCCSGREEISIVNKENIKKSKNNIIDKKPNVVQLESNQCLSNLKISDIEESPIILYQKDKLKPNNGYLDKTRNNDIEKEFDLENLENEEMKHEKTSRNFNASTFLQTKPQTQFERNPLISKQAAKSTMISRYLPSQMVKSPDTKMVKSTTNLNTNKINFSIETKTIRNKQLMKKEYKIINRLGKRFICSVYKVLHVTTNQTRVMRVIKKDSHEFQGSIKRKIDVLKNSHNMNIIKIYEYFEDYSNYYLISEYVNGDKLLDFIAKSNNFNESHIMFIIKQILSVLAYMHKYNITHGNLKPDNIIVEKVINDNVYIKVINFSSCDYLSNTNHECSVSIPYYIAPEAINGVYNEKSDIWSCGFILYFLLVGFPPVNSKSSKELLEAINKGEYLIRIKESKLISREAIDLVDKMLMKDYNLRISALNCLENQFLNKIKTSNNDLLGKITSINTKNFLFNDNLKTAITSYLTYHLTYTQEFQLLKERFYKLDKKREGVLFINEIKSGFEDFFKIFADQGVDDVLERLDINKDSLVNYDEFLIIVFERNKTLFENQLRLCFESNYGNEEDKISVDEIKNAIDMKENKYLISLYKIIDNMDSCFKLDFKDFKQILNTLLQKSREAS